MNTFNRKVRKDLKSKVAKKLLPGFNFAFFAST